MTQSIYWKPKFYVTSFILLSALVLVCIGLISAGEWVTINISALTIYVGGSVVENKVMKDAPPTA